MTLPAHPTPDNVRDVLALVEALDAGDDQAVQVIMGNADTVGCMLAACAYITGFLRGMRDNGDPDVLGRFTRTMRHDHGQDP